MSEYCKHLIAAQYEITEVGGNTVIPNQFSCELKLAYYGMGWEECKKTPFEGPCWQHKNLTAKEWDAWVKQNLESSAE